MPILVPLLFSKTGAILDGFYLRAFCFFEKSHHQNVENGVYYGVYGFSGAAPALHAPKNWSVLHDTPTILEPLHRIVLSKV